MASHAMTNRVLLDRLRKVLEIPQGVRSLDLRMRMDEPPTLTIECIAYDVEVEPEHWLDKRAREAHEQVAAWFLELRCKHLSPMDRWISVARVRNKG